MPARVAEPSRSVVAHELRSRLSADSDASAGGSGQAVRWGRAKGGRAGAPQARAPGRRALLATGRRGSPWLLVSGLWKVLSPLLLLARQGFMLVPGGLREAAGAATGR
jgi:hypothetical protein